MSGKTPHLSPLESRKQLLIAESDLNRAQLAEDWQVMTRGVDDLAHRAKAVAAWAVPAALVVAAVTALRRGPASPGAPRFSWLQAIQNGARLAATLWSALRARGERAEPRQG